MLASFACWSGSMEAALLQCSRDHTATIFRCRGVVTVLSYHLRRDGQRRAIDALPEAQQSPPRISATRCVLVANLLETRDNILRSDFEDSLEGYENKKIVLVD